MPRYSEFKYGRGILYGSAALKLQLWKINNNDPDKGVVARHIKVTINHTGSGKFSIGTVRLLMSRKAHVLSKWVSFIGVNIKRTKTTVNYTGSDMFRLDSIHLKQRIRNRRPVA